MNIAPYKKGYPHISKETCVVVLIRSTSGRHFYWVPQHMFLWRNKKKISVLFSFKKKDTLSGVWNYPDFLWSLCFGHLQTCLSPSPPPHHPTPLNSWDLISLVYLQKPWIWLPVNYWTKTDPILHNSRYGAFSFSQKVLIFFLFLRENQVKKTFLCKTICCGYSLEVPHWGTSLHKNICCTHQKRLTKALLMSTHNICSPPI